MKKFYPLVVLVFALTRAFAQEPVTVLQHNGNAQIFYGQSSLIAAYNAAVNGDTLYLSAGAFNPPASINKGLTIIGSGHFPDSATFKRRTTILSDMYLNAGSDNSTLEGIYLIGWVYLCANDPLNNIVFKRSNIIDIEFQSTSIAAKKSNITISECYMASIRAGNSVSNLVIEKNIFEQSIAELIPLQLLEIIYLLEVLKVNYFGRTIQSLKTNIFLDDGTEHFGDCNNNTFSNIYLLFQVLQLTSIILLQAILVILKVIIIFTVPQSSIFINQTGNLIDYSHNYHLQNPGAYLGTDGTQVGIYGGVIPFKEQGMPQNPQIISKTIGTQTNSNGKLPVNIVVKAQDN
jgi:hypothetical protein